MKRVKPVRGMSCTQVKTGLRLREYLRLANWSAQCSEYIKKGAVMTLENVKRKLEADKKAKPYIRRTIIIGPGGKTREITERVSLEELLSEDDSYIHNPEDPDFEKEMEGEW
jgi:hypothetical protein